MKNIFFIYYILSNITIVYSCIPSQNKNINTVEVKDSEYQYDETTDTDIVESTITTKTPLKSCNQCSPLIHEMNNVKSIDFTETNYINPATGCGTTIIKCSTNETDEIVSFYFEGDPTADTDNLSSIERILNCDENSNWQSESVGKNVTSVECFST
uniref:C6 domain-containing protein n=1 Tax=Strongyloides stercoralis TaxID=6248 RepID=A0A0K0E725_STRER